MQDAMAEARRAMSRLMRILVYRGAGLLLIAAALAALIALVTYNSGRPPASTMPMAASAANWMGALRRRRRRSAAAELGLRRALRAGAAAGLGRPRHDGPFAPPRDVAGGGLAAFHRGGGRRTWASCRRRRPCRRARAA